MTSELYMSYVHLEFQMSPRKQRLAAHETARAVTTRLEDIRFVLECERVA